MKFRNKPLYVFIALLAFLVISICLSYNTFEGFIAFHKTTPPLNQVYVKQYSKNNYLHKVHDSIYFDSVNGNVIELFGTQFSDSTKQKTKTSNIDMEGTSLTNIVLISRPPLQSAPLKVSFHDKTNGKLVVDDSNIAKTTITNYLHSVVPNGMYFKTTPENIKFNYQVVYIPVGLATILHIYDCISNVHIGTYLFRNKRQPAISLYKGGLPTNLGGFVLDEHEKNNTYVNEPLYDPKKSKKTYQVSRNVLFDTTNRNLIVKTTNSISVYNGTTENDRPKRIFKVSEKGLISNTTTSFQDKDFSIFEVLYIRDTEHNSVVLYIPFPSSKKTAVVVISMDSIVLGLISVRNVVIFNPDSENGIEEDILMRKTVPKIESSNIDTTNKLTKCSVGCGDTKIEKKGPEKKGPEKKGIDKNGNIPTLDSIIADYYSKYFNSNTPAVVVNGVKQYSNDFMLKTQTIPPICPACPACPHGGNNSTCVNCGGNGGSGMLKIDSSNNILVNPSTTAIPATTPATKTVVAPSVTPVVAPITKPIVAPVVTPITKPVVAPVVAPITKPVVAPVVAPLTKPIVAPVVTPLTKPLVPPAGLKPNVIEPNTQFRNALPAQNNSYSNYGATEERPSSNFMPVTSDFSAFGR